MWEKIDVPTVMAGEVLAQGDTEHRVHWTLYADGLLSLKANDKYGSLEKDEYPWRDYKDKITSLVIEAGNWLNYVPEYMFFDYDSLETVTVNGTLKTIDASAFRDCDNLTEVTIHGNMGEYEGGLVFWGGIGEKAFQDCAKLERFNVDGVISKIEDRAFFNCNLFSLDAPVLGDIGNSAFMDNEFLSHISPIRGTVGNYAFAGTALGGEAIVYFISRHSVVLGLDAFTTVSPLTNGNLDKSYPRVYYTGTETEFNESYTIFNNDYPYSISYQQIGDNVTWELIDGVLYILGSGSTIDLVDRTEQPWLNIPGRTRDENREQITKVVIRPGIELGEHMLDGLEDRVEVRYDHADTLGTIQWGIYDHVLYISGSGAIPSLYQEDQAAWMPYREEIRKIIIGEGITTVGFGAFMQFPNLETVSFPESLTEIAGAAFYGCPKLDSVTLPENLETLGRNVFTDCTGLTRVYIPASVTFIGSQAFQRTGLTDLFYGGTTRDWAKLGKGEVSGAYVSIDGVSNVMFHASATGLGPSVGGYPPEEPAEDPVPAYPSGSVIILPRPTTQPEEPETPEPQIAPNPEEPEPLEPQPVPNEEAPEVTQPQASQPEVQEPPAPADAANHYPLVGVSTQHVTVNGMEQRIEHYNIDGYNYFKLRDLACVLIGTANGFGIAYDDAARRIDLYPGEAYTPLPTDLQPGEDRSDTATLSTQILYIGGERVVLQAYNIGGFNFFKLRDLAPYLGFRVDYDENTRTAMIETT